MSDYPRVTDILRPYSSYDTVPQDILFRAATRGTIVHGICAGIARAAWTPESVIAEELRGYVSSFRQWREAQVAEFLVVEKRYVDDTLGYSGQIDFLVTCTNGNNYLVDLKTTAKRQKTHPVQMAAYRNLLQVHDKPIKGALIVYLDKSGAFPDIHYMSEFGRELHAFQSALDCWQFFHNKIQAMSYDREKRLST